MRKAIFAILLFCFVCATPVTAQSIWITAGEIAALPASGAAWNGVLSRASSDCGTPDLANQDDSTNVCVMAKALVFAKTGQAAYRDAVVSALRSVADSGTYSGRALALGRELIGYVIAADLIRLSQLDPSLDLHFRDKLRELRATSTSGGPGNLVACHENRPNNWGTHCGGTLAAIAAYLGEAAEMARVAQVFEGWLGNRARYAGFDYGDLSWQCDASAPVGINPVGCIKDGHLIDGVLPDDQRRGGSFTWPPPKENYVYEGLQGALAQAIILRRADYPAFEWENRALLRAFEWLHEQADFPASGDDTWQPHVINHFYGTSFPAPTPSSPGKNVCCTDWTFGPAMLPTPPPPPPIDVTPPTVSFVSPSTQQTVSGTITLTALAQDDFGVLGVRFEIDGQLIDAEDFSAPYYVLLDTVAYSNGSHVLTATVRDAAGNESTTAVTVLISNTVPPPPPSPVPPPLPSTETTQNLKFAFIGDQGNNVNSLAVLRLILDEGAHAVIHAGDFDYGDDPNAWDANISSLLGANFPYFASVGNHDVSAWSGYRQKLVERLARIPEAQCVGDVGVQAECRFRGLHFLLSGAGTMGSGHEAYLRDRLAADNSTWSVCSWHKNQRAMQVGGKSDEVGWGPYEACREGGAIIATGHEHSYSRTRTLSSMQNQTVSVAHPAADTVFTLPGATFAFVSGLGGQSIRDQQRCLPTTPPYGCNGEWASIYTSNQNAKFGALFITFHVDGDPRKARGYFKDISGSVVDRFTAFSEAVAPPPLPPPLPPPPQTSTLRYVHPSVAGNGSGTDWNNACGGFTGACAVGSLVRGAIYYVAGGSYSIGTLSRAESGTQRIIIRRATIASHGTDSGWQNSFDSQVNWTNRLTFTTGYWTFDGVTGRSVPFSQAVPYGFRIADNASGGRGLIEIDNGDRIEFYYTDVDGVSCCHGSFTGPYGIHGNGVGSGFIFSHGAVHNTKSDPIHLNTPGSGVIIEHSYIARNEGLLSNNHGQGIWMQGYSDAHIRHNLFEDVVGTAYTFCGSGAGSQPCSNVQWYGNVLYHTGTHPQSSGGNQSGDEATYIWECTDSNPCPGFKLYNNTIVGFDDWNAGTYPGDYPGASEANNNLWYDISNAGLAIHFSQDYNTFLNSLGLSGANNVRVASGAQNPFVSIADRDFRLAIPTTSGRTLPAPFNVDATGTVRGADGTWDRGAFEFTGTPPPPPPPGQNIPIITTSALPAGQTGSSYAASMTATGGTPPYSWSATDLPLGVSISPTGQLSGTPAVAGEFSPNFIVTDDIGQTAGKILGISISQPPPPQPVPTPGCLISNATDWQWEAFQTQSGTFTATYEVIPSGVVDAVTGLSSGPATSYGSLAVITRFNASQSIDAINGGNPNYASVGMIPYTPGTRYFFRIVVDVATKRYSAWVRPEGGQEVQLADNFAFRSTQADVSSLSYWNTWSDIGSQQVCNFQLGAAPPPSPVPPPPPPPSTNFPVNLQGSVPEERTVTVDVNKPENAASASLVMTVYDADNAAEGQLYVNGNGPLALFGTQGVGANDQAVNTVTFPTPSSWWVNGANTLRFVHTSTAGYRVDGVAVTFAVPPPPSPPPPPPIPPATLACPNGAVVTGQGTGVQMECRP